jgi:tetratricopeptide (TPR) repeat protein
MAIACDKCGIKTEIPEALFKRRKSFRRSFRTECPQCYAKAQLSVLRKNLLWSLVYGVVGLAIVLIWPDRMSGWLLLNLFFFQLSFIASILPHEFGHAFAARWLGFRVFTVYVGYGKTLFAKNLLGFRTEFRAIPLGGFVLATPTDANWFRLKQLTFILAGPIANLALCAITLLFVPLQEIWDFGGILRGAALGQALFYTNLVIFVQSLWPHMFDSPIGKLANDGKLLLQTLFKKADMIDNASAARFALEAMGRYEKHQIADALNWIDQGLARLPANFLLLNWRGILLLEQRQFEAARDCFKMLLARTDNPPSVRALMLNNIAYVDALLGGSELLHEADLYSQEAISLIGWLPAVKGTRGTTLLESGKIEDALVLLHESMEHADSSSGKAQNACFISMGEARRGNLTESRKYLDEARKLMPECFLLERATNEFQTAAAKQSV